MKIEGVGVREISEKFGTPVYAYSMTALRQSIEEIRQLSPVTRYACFKGNARLRYKDRRG